MVKGKFVKPGGDIAQALALRSDVFSREEGLSALSGADGLDALAYNALVYACADDSGAHDTPVATGRIYWKDGAFCISHICVPKDMRGKGYGDLVSRMLLLKATDHNAVRVSANVPVHLTGFFARYGFMAVDAAPASDHGMIIMEVSGNRINLEGACKRQQDGSCGNCNHCPTA